MTDVFSTLRRFPDIEAANLFAHDASDRLLLDEITALQPAGGSIAVINDRYGALTLGLRALGIDSDLRVYQDSYVGELALAENAERGGQPVDWARRAALDAGLLSGAKFVLLPLPKSLSALDEAAAAVASYAASDVTLLAGGRIKHMSFGMNEVLSRYFTGVSASLARQKSRVLIARGVRQPPATATYPQRAWIDELGLFNCAYGAAFGGTKLDSGTRFLLQNLDAAPTLAASEPGARIVDLGCGTGLITAWLARHYREQGTEVELIGADESAAAVASARRTLEENGSSAEIVRADGLEGFAASSVDLVVCNPPFHVGNTVSTLLAQKLFRSAARALRPGGRFVAVFNSYLKYRGVLNGLIGPTRQIAKNPKFTITESVAR